MMPANRRRPRAPVRSGVMALSALCMTILLGSCSRLLGWGVLLWSSEDPPVPSGTVLPVYIRSNIDRVWVVGIPEAYRQPGNSINKYEIPLSQLEFAGSRGKARERAAAFADLALSYAETLQDGLPIREEADNSSRRVYRLRLGEIVKLLERVEGIPAISATGAPLPGEWYRVLTEDGSIGCCFSYRLRIFEHPGGPLIAAVTAPEEEEDPDLERLLSKTWSPESYAAMVNSGRIDLEDLSRRWSFSPGIDAGLARIYLPSLDESFPYTAIRTTGSRAWRFEGAPLQMRLRSENVLEVQYTESGGFLRTLVFAALPSDVDDLIAQETARREELYGRIYAQGPAFSSANYGALNFGEEGRFTWTGYDLLIPRIIPAQVAGGGRVSMDLFLDSSLQSRYDGALSLHFDGIGAGGTAVHFMYTLDSQGLRLEQVPPSGVEGVTVVQRAPSPTVLFFFRDEGHPLPVQSPAEAAPPLQPPALSPSPEPAPEAAAQPPALQPPADESPPAEFPEAAGPSPETPDF